LQGVRAVLFDAVGTLLHPDPPAPLVYATIGHRYGSRLEPAAIASRFAASFHEQERLDHANDLRTSEEREVRRWRYIVGAVLDDVTDPEACFRELFEHFALPESWRCAPGTATTLEGLAARGLRLGLASNYDRRLYPVVAGLPALRRIEQIILSSEIGWRKPAPQFFQAACEVLGLPASEILFVGDDSANDYEGARRSGLRAALLGTHLQALVELLH
jgi:putative hydrolase of the HAD superfamily